MTAVISNPLLGSWHLRRWEITYGDQRPATLPFGADAVGLIVYSTDGWMSASIARGQRPKLSADSVRKAPAAEVLAAFESWFGYAGRYTLRLHGDKPQVVHHVTMALNENFVGTDQVRDIEFDGEGRLTLSASDTVPGSTVARHHRLRWQRA
jgi:Lipocalin-like domain